MSYSPSIDTVPVQAQFMSAVEVSYYSSTSPTSKSISFASSGLTLDLQPGYNEDIVPGSVRFSLGGKEYVDMLGQVYCDIDPATGSGTLAGTISYSTGMVNLSAWNPNASGAVVLRSMVTKYGGEKSFRFVMRTPSAPVRSGSFQLKGTFSDGTTFTVSADTTGDIVDTNIKGRIDYATGIVEVKFGAEFPQADVLSALGFLPDDPVAGKVWMPKYVVLESLRYSAVSYTYLPLDANILGLDPVRLPPDGKVAFFRVGDTAVIHNTQRYALTSISGGASYNVGRVRLSSLKLVDSVGKYVDEALYSCNLDAGVVDLSGSFTLAGLVTPIYAEHRIEDMALIQDVEINGKLTLTRTLTHDYPVLGTYVSSALIIQDMQARVFGMFSQKTWDGSTWSDSRTGDNTLAQFNEGLYPLVVTNKGAMNEKWAIIFTNSSDFRVVGSQVGQIATGNVNSPLAPINPATGAPYFSLNPLGWGGGWASGNILRFNTAAANYPVWIARTVMQGPPTEDYDGFQLQVRGDINR